MTKKVDELIAGFATWRETRKVTTKFQCSVAALILMSVSPLNMLAQNGHSHTQTPQRREMTPGQKANANTLLRIVRDATERYQDVAVAEADGYVLNFGCVSGPDDGAMGLHYINGALVNSGVIDATKPQIIIYEPMPDGSRRPIGADFLVIADQWNATHSGLRSSWDSSSFVRDPNRRPRLLHAACLGLKEFGGARELAS
jgi:hypothetical protein